MKMRITRDPLYGPTALFPGLEDSEYQTFLGSALKADYYNVDICDKVINDLTDVVSGNKETGSWEGVLFEVFFDKRASRFENMLDTGKVAEIETNVFLNAIKAWKEFIVHVNSDEAAVEL